MSDKQSSPEDEGRGRVYVAGLIDRDTRPKSWRDYTVPAIASGIVALIVAGSMAFGSRVVSGGETSAVLTTQVASLLDENKEQRKLLQEITVKLGNVYTREEARADREASERRFQSMESRISDLSRRLDALETRSVLDRAGRK